MNEQNGLICAYILDGSGGGREVGWTAVREWSRADGALWVHLDWKDSGSERWLREEAGVEPVVCEALLAEETRPRCVVIGESLLAVLRGVNLNPGADPEDMVSIRFWIDAHRVISLRHRRLMAVQDIRESIAAGTGPRSPGDFLVRLAGRLIDRMGPVLADLDEQIDGLEDEILETESHTDLRIKLGGLRRQAIALRRHIAPLRDVVSRLQVEPLPWLSDLHRAQLHETADRLTRYVEDLDEAREHAAVAQDELVSRLSERMSRTMYVLSLVAAVFLPLGLLTGLLGINVGGIPGSESPWAFPIVCVVLLGIACVLAWVFHRMKLF